MNFLRLQGNGTSESNRRKTTENISVLVDKNTYYIVYYRLLRYQQAAVAQVVAHLIGNEEVGSSSLLVSSCRNPVDTRSTGFFGVLRILESDKIMLSLTAFYLKIIMSQLWIKKTPEPAEVTS